MRESEQVENRRSLGEWKEIVETVAAFATAGGEIRVGVEAACRPIGVQLGRGTLEDLANKIKLNTEPPQFPSISADGPEDAAVISLEVQASPLKPVWAFGRPFRRVGPTNQRLSPDETRWLIESSAGRTWDSLPCPGLRVEHLDPPAVAAFLRRAGQPPQASIENVLRNLSLWTEGGLPYAAALLFATTPQRFVADVRIHVRFRPDYVRIHVRITAYSRALPDPRPALERRGPRPRHRTPRAGSRSPHTWG